MDGSSIGQGSSQASSLSVTSHGSFSQNVSSNSIDTEDTSECGPLNGLP